MANIANVEAKTFEQARTAANNDPVWCELFTWFATYPMNGHAGLGRSGPVCPFTRQATRLDTVRLVICNASPDEENEAFTLVRRGFAIYNAIPVPSDKQQFRTFVAAFPNCRGSDGIAMLKRVEKRHKYYTLPRFRTLGLLHSESKARGLWNPDFRPLTAPMPVLVIRELVEQDAPFVAGHYMMLAPYLARFGLTGLKRLVAHRQAARGRVPPTAVG